MCNIKGNSLAKQAAILGMAGIIVRLIGFLYRIPLTYMIGDVGNGFYNIAFYIYTFFLIMSSAGLPTAISKIVSERVAVKRYYEAHNIFKVSMKIAIITGAFYMLILFFGAKYIANYLNAPDSKYAIQSLAPTVLIVSIMAVYRGYFQGLKTTRPTAISQLIEQIFNAIFSVLCAYFLVQISLPLGVAGGTMGTGIGAMFGLFILMYIYKVKKTKIYAVIKKYPKKSKSEKYLGLLVIKTAIPIIIGTAIFSITNLIDMKMVMARLEASNAFTNQEIVGLYGQLTGKYVALTNLPVAIATSLAVVSVPNISESFALKDFDTINYKVNFISKIAMLLCIPAGVGIYVLGDPILMFLFPSYPDGGILLKIGAISIIFLSLSQIFTGMLQGIGLLYVPALSALIGGLFKIPLNYYLIAMPDINVAGAVISTTICYIITSSINFGFLKSKTKVKFDIINNFIKPIISATVMGFVTYFTYEILYIATGINYISLFVSIGLGALVYGIMLILVKGITKEESKAIPVIGRRLSKYI